MIFNLLKDCFHVSCALSSARGWEWNKWDRRKAQEGSVLMKKWCLLWGTRKRIKTGPCNQGRWVGRKSEQEAAEDRDRRIHDLMPITSILFPSLRAMVAVDSFPARLLGLRGWGSVSSWSADASRCQKVLLLCISRSSRPWTLAPSWTQTNSCGFYSHLTQVKVTWLTRGGA